MMCNFGNKQIVQGFPNNETGKVVCNFETNEILLCNTTTLQKGNKEYLKHP